MTFDDIVDLAEKAGCDVSAMDGREYQAMWCDSYQLERFAASLIQAGAASRDAEVSRLVEKCHDFAAQHETDSRIIESDGKEIHFLREQCDEWKSRTEFSFGVRDRLEQERNQLRDHVEMLRIALFVIQDNSDDIGVIERALEALEKTEPK